MRWLELYAGIGGAAAALEGWGKVVRAIDHDEVCHRIYGQNWPHPAVRLNLDSVKPAALVPADGWWMSPPCQPFTVRGKGRDLDDPRARSFVHLLGLVRQLQPRALAMENVPGFPGSRAHALLRSTLRSVGYDVKEQLLCPSQLGMPMRRPRWYLTADLGGLPVAADPVPSGAPPTLASFLDEVPDPTLWADDALRAKYRGKLAIVDADDPAAVTHVFTGAYGVSSVYSGSWLATPSGPRRFSPGEILRLMGFPTGFVLDAPSKKKAYKVVGNSLSVHAVRCVLSPWAPQPATPTTAPSPR